jgi:hypothetical protein
MPVYLGLWLELKSEKGRLSGSQIEFINDMTVQGYFAKVAFGIDEAIEIFEDYIK